MKIEQDKIKITVRYWNNSINPDKLTFEYPGIGVGLEEFVNIFRTMLIWLTFDSKQVESIFDKEYKIED